MRQAILVLLGSILLLAATAGATTRDELLLQAQAADALGAALTDAVSRASAEVEAARKHPQKNAAAAATQPRKLPTYRVLFDRTSARIKSQGDAGIEPSLKQLPSGQLFEEMTALQSYNMTQYLRLSRMLDQLTSMRASTTMPSIEKLSETAALELRWRKQRMEIHNAIFARFTAARGQQVEEKLKPSPLSSTYYGVADDPRWQPYFYGPSDGMSGWSDDFSADPFAFRGGGGVYHRFDTRLNHYNDSRTHRQFDRRVNIDSDRRLNIHEDPRENF